MGGVSHPPTRPVEREARRQHSETPPECPWPPSIPSRRLPIPPPRSSSPSPMALPCTVEGGRPIAPFPAARRDADDPPPPISRRSAPSPCAAMSRGGQCSANVRPRQGDPYIRISHGGDDEGLAAAAAASVQHLPPRRRLTRPRPCAARTVGGGRGRVGGGRAVTTPRCRCGPKRRGDPYVGAPARWRRLPR